MVTHVATPTRVLLRLMRPALPLALFWEHVQHLLLFFLEHAPPLLLMRPTSARACTGEHVRGAHLAACEREGA
jgi:hypothetical protein